MTLAIVNNATFENSTMATSHAITLPASIVTGNLLLMFVRYAAETTLTGAGGIPSITGWTTVASREQSDGSGGGSSVHVRQADGTEGATVTATVNNERRLTAITYQLSGHNGTAGITAAVSTNPFSAGNTLDPPSVTASWGIDANLFFAFVSYNKTLPIVTAASANYSGLITASNESSGGANRCYSSTAHRFLTASSDDAAAPTIGGTDTPSSPHAYGVVVQPAEAVAADLYPAVEPLYYLGSLLANKTGIKYLITAGHTDLAGEAIAFGSTATTNGSGVLTLPAPVDGIENGNITLHLYWEEGNPAVDRSLIVKTTLVAA
jgi:hypothetical protein